MCKTKRCLRFLNDFSTFALTDQFLATSRPLKLNLMLESAAFG